MRTLAEPVHGDSVGLAEMSPRVHRQIVWLSVRKPQVAPMISDVVSRKYAIVTVYVGF